MDLAVVADAVVVGHAVDNGIPSAFQIGLVADDPCGGDCLFFTVQVEISDLDDTRGFLDRFCYIRGICDAVHCDRSGINALALGRVGRLCCCFIGDRVSLSH